MTAYEIYNNIKKNGIPVGLDAWMPSEIKTEEKTWRDYVPKLEKSTNQYRKDFAYYFYGRGMEEAEAKSFFQQAKQQAEKEALEHARMYFG